MSKKDSRKTLVDLTRDFIELLKAANGNDVDLSKAEKLLGASKRRLYDVSNVLSGVGLIERSGKSRIRWVGRTSDVEIGDMHLMLREKERELDSMIELAEKYMNELSCSQYFQNYAWVTEEDLLTLDPEGAVNLFALRGPPSMTIQVDQKNGEHHVVCKTDEGKIEMIQIESSKRC